MKWWFAFAVDIPDEQALWDAARDDLMFSLNQEDMENWIGTREEPDVLACLYQLFDPDNRSLLAVKYITRSGGHLDDKRELFYHLENNHATRRV